MTIDALSLVLAASAAFAFVAVVLFATRGRYGAEQAAPQFEQQSTREIIIRLFWIALAIRLIVAAAIYALGISDFFAPDRVGYEIIGRAIARTWQSRGTNVALAVEIVRPYHYYNAVVFYLVGDVAPVLIRILNGIAGATAVPLSFAIARSIFGERVGLRSAQLVAFMPSLVLWSAVNIRDAWAVLAVLWTVFAALRLRDQITLTATIQLLLALALLGGIRGYMFLIVALGVVLSYASTVGGSILRNYAAGMIACIVFIYLYGSLGFGRDLVEIASFESLSAQREAATVSAGSAYYQNVDISTPGKALAFAPIGVAYFLFAPFPWNYQNARQAITFPEMLVWWALAIRFLMPGILAGLRLKIGHSLTVLSVAIPVVITYGLVEGNVGTAYRHRAQVLPLLLCFAAAGYEFSRSVRKPGLPSQQPT